MVYFNTKEELKNALDICKKHNAADFKVTNSGEVIDFKMKSRDGSAAVELKARVTNCWGGQSQFATLAEASDFFEPGRDPSPFPYNGRSLARHGGKDEG